MIWCPYNVGIPFSAHFTASFKLSRTKNTTPITGQSYINGITRTITQLGLPFSKIIDRPPRPPLERDLVIPEQELRSFAEDIWSVQTIPGSRNAFKLVYCAHLLSKVTGMGARSMVGMGISLSTT